jgi:hypothetical protein
LFLVVLVVVFAAKYRKHKQLALSGAVFVKPKADMWEFDPNSLQIGRKLGQGNFGVVFSGTANNVQPDLPGQTSVAVKMVHEDADAETKRDLLAEANLMKRFSKPWHANVCCFRCPILPMLTFQGCSSLWCVHTGQQTDDCHGACCTRGLALLPALMSNRWRRGAHACQV